MSELTKDLIQSALDQDFNKANQVFNDMMSNKMSDILDQTKVALAGQMFNGEEPEDDEIDDEQLELELDDDEGSDEDTSAEDFEIDEIDLEAEGDDEEEEEE
jgi:hypothetical protein